MRLGQISVLSERRDHRLLRLLRDSHGASQIEYALLIALILATAFFAVEGLSHVSRDSLTTLTEKTGRSSRSDGTTRRTASKAAASRATNVGIASPTPTPTPTPPATIHRYRLLVQFGFLALSAAMLAMLHRQRKKLDAKAVGGDQKISPEHHAKLFAKRQQILTILSGNTDAVVGGEMLVRQLMSVRLETVSPSARREEVEAIMVDSKLRHLLVCNKGRLVGVISDRDVHHPKNRTAKKTTASDLMTSDPLTASPEMLVSPAVTLMMEQHISCLPVVDSGELVGLLTSTDLMMALQCSLQLLQQIALEISPSQSAHSTNLRSRAEDAVRDLISAGR